MRFLAFLLRMLSSAKMKSDDGPCKGWTLLSLSRPLNLSILHSPFLLSFWRAFMHAEGVKKRRTGEGGERETWSEGKPPFMSLPNPIISNHFSAVSLLPWFRISLKIVKNYSFVLFDWVVVAQTQFPSISMSFPLSPSFLSLDSFSHWQLLSFSPALSKEERKEVEG